MYINIRERMTNDNGKKSKTLIIILRPSVKGKMLLSRQTKRDRLQVTSDLSGS